MFKRLVTDALDQIVAEINAHNLDQEKEQTPAKFIGPSERPDLFDHKEKYIGARQDTYVPADKMQMPKIWKDERLHVVESRKDTVDRLKSIAKAY